MQSRRVQADERTRARLVPITSTFLMQVYLIRHAQAGQREEGHSDAYRRLSDKGEARAFELIDLFDSAPIARVFSSPATRCVQTVTPLADARGLIVEENDVLWEDAYAAETLAFLEKQCAETDGSCIVACSHGNIIPELIDLLGRRDVAVTGHGCEKGSVWVLTNADGIWTEARRVKKKADSV